MAPEIFCAGNMTFTGVSWVLIDKARKWRLLWNCHLLFYDVITLPLKDDDRFRQAYLSFVFFGHKQGPWAV